MLRGYYAKKLRLRQAWTSERFPAVFALTSRIDKPEILSFLRSVKLPVADVFAIGFRQTIGIFPTDDLVNEALERLPEVGALDPEIHAIATRLAKRDKRAGFNASESRWTFWRNGSKEDWAKVRALADACGYQPSYIFAYGLVISLQQLKRLDLIGGVL